METDTKYPGLTDIHQRDGIQLSHVHRVYFKFTGNECTPGKSYIANKSGEFYVYLGDDTRSFPAQQIIVTRLGGGDLFFLSIDCKKEIEIISKHK